MAGFTCSLLARADVALSSIDEVERFLKSSNSYFHGGFVHRAPELLNPSISLALRWIALMDCKSLHFSWGYPHGG